MDISKLPKLSGSNVPPPPGDVPIAPPVVQQPVAPALEQQLVVPEYSRQAGGGSIGLAEAWISLALGVLLLFINPGTIQYLHSPTDFAQNYPVNDAQGNPISYVHSAFFWSDLGVTVFAAALILEGIAMAFLRRSGLLWISFSIAVVGAVFNIYVIIRTHGLIDFPLLCGLGVAVLGYMAITQWRLIQALRK
jgi:hypothetical protein